MLAFRIRKGEQRDLSSYERVGKLMLSILSAPCDPFQNNDRYVGVEIDFPSDA